MKAIEKQLEEWRAERNITASNTKVYVKNIIEELLEIFYKEKGSIDFLSQEIFDKYFDLNPIGEKRTIDAINDISVFSINENETMGYYYTKCMNETIKEISSRKQDPIQKEEWIKNGPSGKWQKDANQPKETLYKANYDFCIRL